MKKIVRDFLNQRRFTAFMLIITLAAANVCVLMSIVGARPVPLRSTPQLTSNIILEEALAPMQASTAPQSADISMALDEILEMYPEMDSYNDDQGWMTVRMRVTAYCPCRKCCGKFSDGRTACNHRIRPGDTFVAADKIYPFGTEIVIPGYNDNQPVKVLDRGRVIRGYRLDVFFNSHYTAKKWGTRYLYVKMRLPQ